MIPILYPADEATKGSLAFKTNGIGGLGDAISCVVREKRNAEYELEMTYPVSGIHFEDIKIDMFIDAMAHEYGDKQHFRIYEIEEPIEGTVTIKAEHVSYLLTKVVVLPFTAYSATDAFLNLENNLQWNSEATNFKTFPFTFWTDVNKQGEVKIETPMSIRSALGGVEGSILDKIGGEYEFDNFTVKLHSARGIDDGVRLRYGKNITDLTNTLNISSAFTGIMAYWKGNLDVTYDDLDENYNVVTESVETVMYVTTDSQEAYISENPKCTNYLNGKTLWISNDDNIYAYPLAVPVDLSSIELEEYEEPELERDLGEEDNDEDDETEEHFGYRVIAANQAAEAEYRAYVLRMLTAEANRYLDDNAKKAPLNTIKVSFVQLANTPEYADVAPLEHVNLCDIVHVHYPEFKIDVKTKVVETEYNVLLNKYDSVTLGDVVNNAAESILSSLGETERNISSNVDDKQRDMNSIIRDGIARATAYIRGGMGGHVVFNLNPAGQPNELLIMDTPKKSTARKVWRFNLGGLGFSDHGYNGPFDKIALTMNGEINASRILTGELDATVIKTGIIKDVNNYNYWDLDSGEFRMAATTKVGTEEGDVPLTDYVGDVADLAINTYDSMTLTRQKIFDKLTNNGTIQGLYMDNQGLYIAAEYVQAGTFKTRQNLSNYVMMEGETAAIKGYYNPNTTGIGSLISVFDTVNGQSQDAKTVLAAKNGIAFLAPAIYVKQMSNQWNPTSKQNDVYTGVTANVELPYYIASYGSNGVLKDLNVYTVTLTFVNGIFVGSGDQKRYNTGASTFDGGGGSSMILQGRSTDSNWTYPANAAPMPTVSTADV